MSLAKSRHRLLTASDMLENEAIYSLYLGGGRGSNGSSAPRNVDVCGGRVEHSRRNTPKGEGFSAHGVRLPRAVS